MAFKNQTYNKYASDEARIAARKEQNRKNALAYYNRNKQLVSDKNSIKYQKRKEEKEKLENDKKRD